MQRLTNSSYDERLAKIDIASVSPTLNRRSDAARKEF
jgi:hypothetical protein